MKSLTLFRKRLATGVCLAAAATATFALLLSSVYAGGDAKSAPTPESTPATGLSGADLYAINCNRCHAERYPKEFQSSQWKTIMIHMRVRAGIPASQAREILKYLQDESGN